MSDPVTRREWLRARIRPAVPEWEAVQSFRQRFARDGVLRGVTFEQWMAELVDPTTGKPVQP